MRVAWLFAVALAVGLSGCAEMSQGLAVFGREAADVPLPYVREYREAVLPQHARSYPAPVEADARALNATLSLELRDGGVGAPQLAPGVLTLEVRDPSGALVGQARVDAAHPVASVVVETPIVGEHTLRVAGAGASESVDGVRLGAAYALVLEIVYG